MPGVIPYPALPLAVAVEPRPGWAASADQMEAPPRLPEESSLEPGLVPATGEELALQSAPGPLLEPGIIPPALLLPPEVVFHLCLTFSLSILQLYIPVLHGKIDFKYQINTSVNIVNCATFEHDVSSRHCASLTTDQLQDVPFPQEETLHQKHSLPTALPRHPLMCLLSVVFLTCSAHFL